MVVDGRVECRMWARGAADAVGYVNGRFVSGTIQLSSQPVHAADKDGQSPEAVEKSGPPAAVVKQAAWAKIAAMAEKAATEGEFW